ncbi:urea ABC transporter permease subunit UrtB [Hwanghaeella grinnelliae]|uniref:Urea ABC transporter permease subunit UrtB n=1 Tax=Hwanghaeella grinnelliae TaxID=2500179 RepID=A0A437QWL9_9PROT|nr:urea ABC transporter permease subunit UrtB [Hwanghaeella grinnelliae]RVU38911.1 urea ABC transporter permease subunit UrtB [Hwanghaeella grinnelliae]
MSVAALISSLRTGLVTALAALVLAICVTGTAGAQDAASEDALKAALPKLTERSFDVKGQAIKDISTSGDPRALDLLLAIQEGDLYYRKSDDLIVYAADAESGYDIKDALTGEDLGNVGKRKVKKISINNQLRSILKGAIGSLELMSPNPDQRVAAARAMLSNPTADAMPILLTALEKETDPAVRDMLDLAKAALEASIGSVEDRLAAVEIMAGSMNPDVWAILGRLAAKSDGSGSEDETTVGKAAQQALNEIEGQKQVFALVETVYFGLSLGAVLLLAAVGLAITFGVMGVINMAHGEMLMIGAYVTFVVQQLMPNHIEYSLFVAIPAAFVVTGLIGIGLERSVIRVLYGRPLETLLATFGISLFLQQTVRSVFSPLNQPVTTPEWMSGFYEVNGALSLTYNRLYIILFCLIVFAALLLLLRKTPLGLQMRAVTQNRAMASSMGIRTGWVDAMTFGLGSGVAGIGGVALSQLTNVGPNLGQAYIIDSFMVVVFGGVGNLWGTFVGAMSLGVANKFLEPFTGAVVAKIIVLVLIILFIQRRPRGLFALKGRSVEG